MTTSIKLATDAPDADMMFVPPTGKFQQTVGLQQTCGSSLMTSLHAVLNVREDFASASTIMIVVNFISMLYLNFRGSEEEG